MADDQKKAAEPSTRAVWSAMGDLRKEFAEHRKEDREDFKGIRDQLTSHADELGDVKAMCSGFDAKLDTLLEERAHARQTGGGVVALAVQTEHTKRVELTTRGKVIAGILGFLTALATAIATGKI